VTGGTVVHAETGLSFEKMAERRRLVDSDPSLDQITRRTTQGAGDES
jgi:hypothetical protein